MHESRTYASRRTYAVPAQLADLTGPACGAVDLPRALAWTGRHSYDLDDPMDVAVFYERVIVEAAGADDLVRLIHPAMLRTVWARLYLPAPVRRLWETRFPELTAAA